MTTSATTNLHYQKRKNQKLFKSLENPEILFLTESQNYIPIYKRFFHLNETNYNCINLNHPWFIKEVQSKITENIYESVLENIESEKKIKKNVFFKLAPLLDPFKYMVGKYNLSDHRLFQLPKLLSDETNVLSKILDENNSAYIDSFFLYLNHFLIYKHHFVHGVDYYGSFLSLKKNYSINVFDDLEYLTKSEFFMKNKNTELFQVEPYEHLFYEEDEEDDDNGDCTDDQSHASYKKKTKLIHIVENEDSQHHHPLNLSFKSLGSLQDLNDNVWDSSSLHYMDDMEVCDVTNETLWKNRSSSDHSMTLKSSSSCSSRTSHTMSESEYEPYQDMNSSEQDSSNHPRTSKKKSYTDEDGENGENGEDGENDMMCSFCDQTESFDSVVDQMKTKLEQTLDDSILNSGDLKHLKDQIRNHHARNLKREQRKKSEIQGNQGIEEHVEEGGEEDAEDWETLVGEDEEGGMDVEEEEEDEDILNEEEKIYATLPVFPVQIICMENCDNTLDDLIVNEQLSQEEWFSILMQVIMILLTFQKVFRFTHNDLHSNNVMYVKTEKKYLYYCYEKKYYKVPTFGRIMKIIDFGRSIYTYDGKIFCSDSFQAGGDAASQYNVEPYFNHKKPRIEPNESFDLCRLACSIYDYMVDDMDKATHPEKCDPVTRIIVDWCMDDKGLNVLYKKNGDERYPDFKLYKMIARCVHRHTPEAQLERKEFKQYLVGNKALLDKNKKIVVMNLDEMIQKKI